MNIKQLTKISLMALGAIAPLFAAPVIEQKEADSAAQNPDNLMMNIIKQKEVVKQSEEQFKKLVASLIRKGQLVSIDALVTNKTPEYTAAWKKVNELHAAYKAANGDFSSGKDEPEAVKKLRADLTAKQESYKKLEEEDTSVSLSAVTNAAQFKQKIQFLELEISGQKDDIASIEGQKKSTEGKLKGLKAKKTPNVDIIQQTETMIQNFDGQIAKLQQAIKENEKKVDDLKENIEQDSGISLKKQGLLDKRSTKKAMQQDIYAIKADLKKALEQHSAGRVNKKAVKDALDAVVIAYTQFVQKFINSDDWAQNCLEKCTELLLQNTENDLTKPAGTCAAGGGAPGVSSLPGIQRSVDADSKTDDQENLTDSETDGKANVTDSETSDQANLTDSETSDQANVTDAELVVKQDSLTHGTDELVDSVDQDQPVVVTADTSVLIGRIGSLMSATKNTKKAHINKLLGGIDWSDDCAKIKALQTSDRLTDQQKMLVGSFLEKYEHKCVS